MVGQGQSPFLKTKTVPNINQIPTLKPGGLDDFHFGNVKWQLPFSQVHHLFHINRLETYRDKIAFPLPPHRKTVYDFVFLTKGTSTRSKGLNQYTFGENEFFFLPAYQITSHEYMSEDAEGYFVHFDAEIFRSASLHRALDNFLFLNFLAKPVITVSLNAQKPILNILSRLEDLYFEVPQTDFGLVVFYLLALLTEAKKFVIAEKKLAKNSALYISQQYKNALTQHIYQKQSVSEYADLLNVTPNHLNKCVRATTHKTAQDLLNEMLILEAKSLLKYSNLQIAEIAVKLCNQTPSNFARFFKNQTGVSPKEYQ